MLVFLVCHRTLQCMMLSNPYTDAEVRAEAYMNQYILDGAVEIVLPSGEHLCTWHPNAYTNL